MGRDKRWKEAAALFVISAAIFGFAEYSQNSEQAFEEMQNQVIDENVQEDIAQTDIDSEEISAQETESEETSEQETESENALEQEMESEDISEQETENPFGYDSTAPFVEGLAYFSIEEEYGFMDETGTPVFYLDCDSVSNFWDGLAYISVDGKYGYIDQKGEIVIEPVYHDADYFQDGYAIIMKNGKFGVIDKTGKEVIEPKYQEIERGGENFVVKEGEKYQILNRNGDGMLKSPCEEIYNYTYYDPAVGFRDKEQGICGFAAGENVVYFEEDYEWMSFIPQRELVILKKDGSYGIKDFQRNTIVPFVYEDIYYNPDDDVFYVRNKGKDRSITITADNFTGRAVDEKVKEKYAQREELSKDLQYNKLTPRVSEYMEFLEHGSFFVQSMHGGSGFEIDVSELNNKIARLYDLGEIGNPALYLYGHGDFKDSYGGFFAIQGEEVVCLLSAENGGGSGGGERACLWYDCEEGRFVPGKSASLHYGGGAGRGTDYIYDWIDGKLEEKLTTALGLYAGPEGGPMTTTYYVNGETTTEEHYKEVRRRYSRVEMIR